MGNCKLVQSIANDAAPSVGFDPSVIITIISAVLPVISQIMTACKPQPKPGDYRNEVAARYSAKRDQYAGGLLRRVKRTVVDNSPGLTMHDIDAETLAIETLDHIRTGSDDDLQECMSAMGQ